MVPRQADNLLAASAATELTVPIFAFGTSFSGLSGITLILRFQGSLCRVSCTVTVLESFFGEELQLVALLWTGL